ncbi:MAG TPA: MBL fold metallo-hydrolase, partial [Tepidisphaeraceae bacterium]|nr:MBL fold metallo-hydrolase [Tepidisphaeraceae bacterium]
KRLDGTGATLDDIRAICLTHLDRDHFNLSWLTTILKRGIRLFVHRTRREELLERVEELEFPVDINDQVIGFDGHAFEPVPKLSLESIPLAHDREGSHGFVIEGFGCRIGWATDLGRVPSMLIERFEDLDVLAIESNYDPQMQRTSGRPVFLQNRIMNGSGHLSNAQAFEAICRILDRCEGRSARLPSHIVLLHRSRACNCPKLVRKFFSRDQRIAPRLTLAEQFERTHWIRPRPMKPLVGEQLAMVWD